MADDLAGLLHALVATQKEIVDALAEATEDLRAVQQRLERLESAAGLPEDTQPIG